jgi:hypothetical protein
LFSEAPGLRPLRPVLWSARTAGVLLQNAALHDPTSRTYYDRKRARGKRHNAALIRLARRRVDVLFAMLKNGTTYEHRSPSAV